jgi:hypothetical protein
MSANATITVNASKTVGFNGNKETEPETFEFFKGCCWLASEGRSKTTEKPTDSAPTAATAGIKVTMCEEVEESNEDVRNEISRCLTLLARDAMGLDNNNVSAKERKLINHMRFLVDQMLLKHAFSYQGILQKLSAAQNPRQIGCHTLYCLISVVQQMFSDSRINWGRLVSLFAFTKVWVGHEKTWQKSKEAQWKDAREFGSYLMERTGDWIEEQGGMYQLMQCLPNHHMERQKLFLGMVAGTCGLAALTVILLHT